MITTIILIIINLLFILSYPKEKKQYDNEYSKNKYIFNRKKIFYLLFVINIINFLIYLLYSIAYKVFDNFAIIKPITMGIQLLSFVPLVMNAKRYNKPVKLINKPIFNDGDILFIVATAIISAADKSLLYAIYDQFYDIANIILLIVGLIFIIKKIFKSGREICYSIKEKDFLPDIRFARKLEINKIINCFVYVTLYILLVLAKINYAYIGFAIILLFMTYYLVLRIKRVGEIANKTTQTVNIIKEAPGVEFAYFYQKELLDIRKFIISIILAVIGLILFYAIGDGQFIYSTFGIFNLLLYVIIDDKQRLIKYVKGLNKNLVDKKKYSVKVDKKVTCIDNINVFNIKLYKLVVIDNLVYESNLVMYDPELLIDKIEIRINKNNLNDYIFNERILYEDDIEELTEEDIKKLNEELEEKEKGSK